ncbi:MAG: peptidoglycan binding domain-containing protein [Chloroflexota bacterium]
MQSSSTAKPPSVHATHVNTPREASQSWLRGAGPLKFTVIGLCALLVAVVALGAWYQFGHNERVYNGVTVLGKSLSGMSKQEATLALQELAAGYPSDKVTVAGAGRNWTFSAAEVGVALDVDKTLDAAMSVGRSGNLFQNLGTQLSALTGGAATEPLLKQNAATIENVVAQIAADVDTRAVDSKLEKGSDGVVTLSASSSGTAVDRPALALALTNAVASVPFSSVNVTTQVVAPKVTEAALNGTKTQALLLTEQPIVLQAGDETWTMEPADLRELLTLNHGADGSLTAALDNNSLAAYLQPLAQKVLVEPTDASVVIGKGTVTLNKDVSGQALEVTGAIAAIEKAAVGQDAESRVAVLPLKEVPASVHTEAVQGIYDSADSLINQGMRLRYADDGYILRGTSVTGFLDVQSAQGGPGPMQLVIDEDVLANRVAGVAYYINRPMADARFMMVNGVPTKVADAKQGLKVNIDASMQRAKQAIESYTGGDRLQVELDVAVTEPNIKDTDLGAVNTPDLLASGTTSYVGSSANRAWNVELGTSHINGTLIPPGGIFSTVDTIGDLTLDAGFKMGYAIMQDGRGGLTTVPAEAGGICQVSTTLFHAVFRSGLEVVERNWHSYWISTYGKPPSGLQGLDATIAPPDKDFRFKNNTGNWILIKASAGKGTVLFELYGVNPGWTVAIGKPVITNVVKTSQADIVEYSDALPKSTGKVMVEHAQDGFNSSISRVVTDSSGNVIDNWTAKSTYAPAHNRYLIGTGPEK